MDINYLHFNYTIATTEDGERVIRGRDMMWSFGSDWSAIADMIEYIDKTAKRCRRAYETGSDIKLSVFVGTTDGEEHTRSDYWETRDDSFSEEGVYFPPCNEYHDMLIPWKNFTIELLKAIH